MVPEKGKIKIGTSDELRVHLRMEKTISTVTLGGCERYVETKSRRGQHS